ncbi:MAG TPA: hypothetical protein VF284_01440 [Rhodanobacteraceae bacterium]
MKQQRLIVAALVALCGGAVLAMPAMAQTNPDPAQTTVQATTARAMPATRHGHQRAVPPLDSRQCIRDTGSHIPPPKGQCLPVAGNSYSQQDIQRTGATNLGQALKMLDPSVTVRGH